MKIFIWEPWRNPEWIHLLVSALGVRVCRTWGFMPLFALGMVFVLGVVYEFVIWFFVGYRPSMTDIIADLIGCTLGLLV